MCHFISSAPARAAAGDTLRDQLTIVIPALNCSEYLPAAVSSALYSAAGRILIADDGSRPDHLAVAKRLAAAHPDRIRVLASPVTRGTSANMNEAAKHIETPFFAKLDGDDVLIPGHLESVFPIIASCPRLAVVAGHDLRIAADEAMEFCPALLPRAGRHDPAFIMEGSEAYRFVVAWNPNPTSSGVIYRTEAFRAVGGFDQQIQWGEDWEIWLRFAREWQVAYVPAPSALYRIHQNSTTAAVRRQNRICFGYDAVFRRAAELCDHPDVTPLIRRRMFGVAKLYAAAAVRQLRGPAGDSAIFLLRGLQALWAAMGGGRRATARAWTPLKVAPAPPRN